MSKEEGPSVKPATPEAHRLTLIELRDSGDISDDTVRQVMADIWSDHQSTREQTWKALHIVSVLTVGLVTLDITKLGTSAFVATAILVVVAALFGIVITVHHRRVESQKFSQLLNCECYLRVEELLVVFDKRGRKEPTAPKPFTFWSIFTSMSTPAFILRMHLFIIALAVILVVNRLTHPL
ncbi:MAG: hypothetical protein JSS66_17415 [Armatimonadetes bacterium]|nr:hypothetical protein [Armatimonadota bacterium]